jgi:uncharacterized protein (DUF433 family)
MQPDWSQCPNVESVPGRLSGQWVVRHTRIPVQALIDNAEDGYSAEAIAGLYQGLDAERTKRILSFARMYDAHSA